MLKSGDKVKVVADQWDQHEDGEDFIKIPEGAIGVVSDDSYIKNGFVEVTVRMIYGSFDYNLEWSISTQDLVRIN